VASTAACAILADHRRTRELDSSARHRAQVHDQHVSRPKCRALEAGCRMMPVSEEQQHGIEGGVDDGGQCVGVSALRCSPRAPLAAAQLDAAVKSAACVTVSFS